MKCEYCGAEIQDSEYCPECGEPVEENTYKGNETKIMVFGILGLALSGIIGLFFASSALSMSKSYISAYGDTSSRVRTGRRLALAGLIVSIVLIVAAVIFIVVLINNPDILEDRVNAIEKDLGVNNHY